MMPGEWRVNVRPLPRPGSFRWASPMVWNGTLRNWQGAIRDHLGSSRMTDEARENIRAAMVMCGMEASRG